jgi:hypothetical protein
MSKEAWFAAYESGRSNGMSEGEAIRTAPERISSLSGFISACATQSVNCDPRPVSLIAEEMDEQRRRRRERLRREAMQQAARELEEALGLEYLAIDAGCLSAVFETLNAKLEGLR